MEGIGPGLNQFLREVFSSIFKQTLPDRVREHAGETLKLNNDQKRQLHKIIREMCAGACDEAFAALFQRMSVEYINPVVEATEYLNKAELAAMAETLVNLVSFRKQVTMEAETVG
ncbi:MAG: hypothetical protein MI741_07640, partial [Rhodospirillales bacterium]|nr:hypothetical protein [Rhodospirillales bacterium]